MEESKKLTGDELNYVSGQKASLLTSRKRKFDEFYTQLSDIEAELRHYKRVFKGKVVYCNCDAVREPENIHSNRNSAFYTYFREQFERFHLKALFCSWKEEGSKKCHVLRFDGSGPAQVTAFPDPSDGSYDGLVAQKFLSACDIVVTNPPFSVFKEYFEFLVKSGKRYLMVAPGTSPTYKSVFPELMNDRCKVGYNALSHFLTCGKVPAGIKLVRDKALGCDVVSSNCMWLTNLMLNDRPAPLQLWNTYDKDKFFHYYNLPSGIDMPTVKDIPKDWKGFIGTSVNFFTYYNPSQFKVWGLGVGNLMNTIPGMERLDKKFVDDYKAAGGRGAYTPNFPILGFYDDAGIAKIPFARVIIQLKEFL